MAENRADFFADTLVGYSANTSGWKMSFYHAFYHFSRVQRHKSQKK